MSRKETPENKAAKKQGNKRNVYRKSAPQIPLDVFDREESGYNVSCDLLTPVFGKDAVVVCIVSSDEYAPFAAVTVQSIISNASENQEYDIVLLSNDMLLRNRWRISQLAEGFQNISVRVLDISEIVKGFSFYTWAHFTSNTYYRLLTPDIFSSYAKVIYLDSDVVVNHDLAELFQTDLGDHLLAAAYDTHVVSYCSQDPPLEQREYNIKTLHLDPPEEYFQAGVTIFNIKAFHEKYEEGYLIQQAGLHKMRWLDQDLLNMLFQGQILPLDNRWNIMISNMPDFLDEYYLPPEMRKAYYEARQSPYIIHYVGRAMPCYTTSPDLYEYFWKYARMTPFYEILLQRMTIDYVDKKSQSGSTNDRMLAYIQELQGECKYLRSQYSALCKVSGISVPIVRPPLRSRIKRRVMPWFNRMFPVGSKRRLKASHLYHRIRNK